MHSIVKYIQLIDFDCLRWPFAISAVDRRGAAPLSSHAGDSGGHEARSARRSDGHREAEGEASTTDNEGCRSGDGEGDTGGQVSGVLVTPAERRQAGVR